MGGVGIGGRGRWGVNGVVYIGVRGCRWVVDIGGWGCRYKREVNGGCRYR